MVNLCTTKPANPRKPPTSIYFNLLLIDLLKFFLRSDQIFKANIRFLGVDAPFFE